jgi:hypothetical protein
MAYRSNLTTTSSSGIAWRCRGVRIEQPVAYATSPNVQLAHARRTSIADVHIVECSAASHSAKGDLHDEPDDTEDLAAWQGAFLDAAQHAEVEALGEFPGAAALVAASTTDATSEANHPNSEMHAVVSSLLGPALLQALVLRRSQLLHLDSAVVAANIAGILHHTSIHPADLAKAAAKVPAILAWGWPHLERKLATVRKLLHLPSSCSQAVVLLRYPLLLTFDAAKLQAKIGALKDALEVRVWAAADTLRWVCVHARLLHPPCRQ